MTPLFEAIFHLSELERISDALLALVSKRIILLQGNLGSGKTTLTKKLIEKLTGTPEEEITSPTFSFVSEYEGAARVAHFDLYRLRSSEEFIQRGFFDYLDGSWDYVFIEWPEKIGPLLPKEAHTLSLSFVQEDSRYACLL